MMTPLHRQAVLAATTLLSVLPTASALVPRLSTRQIRTARNIHVRKIARATAGKTASQLSLGVDPTDIIVQNAHHLHDFHHHAMASESTSTLDLLSSLTLAKASSIVPNQSVAPLAETVRSTLDGNSGGLIEAIPDLPSMPGGAPRSGNPFLAESFRELYGSTLQSNPRLAPYSSYSDASGALVVPAREWDVVARYADLLDRVPVAAAAYALLDFFVLNAEEDLAIAELLDDEEMLEAIADVERRVITRRFLGLFAVVAVTVAWSLFTYHPVPFNEL